MLGHISDTALTSDAEIQMTAAGLPNTFVPGRNLLFFQLAAAVGYRRGLHALVGGMCETDFSGYPDCRDDPQGAAGGGVALGMGQRFPSRPADVAGQGPDLGTGSHPGGGAGGSDRAGTTRTPATTGCAN